MSNLTTIQRLLHYSSLSTLWSLISITRYAVDVFRNILRLSCSSCVKTAGAEAAGAIPGVAAAASAGSGCPLVADGCGRVIKFSVAGSSCERALADSEA